jgi:copper chaperone CopZ
MVADGKYFCPMHPTQQSDNPDAPCPICKMRLESKAEYNKKMDAEHEALENKYAGKTGLIHFEVKLSPVKSDECQPVIEKALSSDKGVVEYHIDIVNKVIHMYIDKNKTTKAAVEKAIADAGFDANDTKAGPDAVAKLPPDCR